MVPEGKRPSLAESPSVCDGWISVFVGSVLNQCVDEGQGSGDEPSFTSPRLLSGSEMKALLQWEESESHPLPTLEKQITVQMQGFFFFFKVKVDASFGLF